MDNPNTDASSLAEPSAAADSPTPGDSLLHGMAIALVLTVLQRCSGLFRGVLFCWVLDDRELGLWSLAQSWLMALAPLAVLGITGCLRRYAEHYRQRGQLIGFLKWVLGVSGGLTLLSCVGIILGAEPLSDLLFRSPDQVGLVRLMGLTLVCVVLFNTLQDLCDSLKMLRVASLMRLLHSVAFTVAGAAIVFAAGANTYFITVAFLLATVFACLPAGVLFRRGELAGGIAAERLDARSMWRKVIGFAGWLWILNIVANLFELSDRYMLLLFSDLGPEGAQALVGQMHSSRVVPLLLLGLATLVSNSLMPYLVTFYEQGRMDQLKGHLELALKLTAVSATIGGWLVIAFAPLLFGVVLGGRYDEGLSVLPMTLVYCTWLGLFYISEDYLWCCERGRWPTLSMGIGLLANVGLNAALIPPFGLLGASVATMVGNFIALLALFTISGRFGWSPTKGTVGFCLLPASLVLGPLASAGVMMVVVLTLVRGRGLSAGEWDAFRLLAEKVRSRLPSRLQRTV